MVKNSSVWLIKYLASIGVTSRRKVEELIKSGKVSVNGKIVKEPATKIDPKKDEILVNGQKIEAKNEEFIYILLNKPKGIVSTVSDELGRKTVLDLVKIPQRIYPVGRLDQDSRGLIILTNDGDLTLKLTHPKFHLEKTYHALIPGKINNTQLEMLRNGIFLKEGKTAPAKVYLIWEKFNRTLLEITLFEGKNRQIRRMLGRLNLELLDLQRVSIGKIGIGNLKEGEYRYLSVKELENLRSKKLI